MRSMKPVQLLQLLRHVEQTTVCPQCSAPVFPENVSVLSSVGSSAVLQLSCPECHHDFFAHIFVNQSEIYSEISSEKDQEKERFELEQAHRMLSRNLRSISELFSSES